MWKMTDFMIKTIPLIIKFPDSWFTFNVIFAISSYLRSALTHQLFYLLALSLEQDIPDYDMDSADEMWFDSQTKTELTPFKFEQMMDRLEKITTFSLDDAKGLVKRNEVNQDVFDYWVTKRLSTVRKSFSGSILYSIPNSVTFIVETSTYTGGQNRE